MQAGKLIGMIDWFVVMTDDSSVSLSVSPPVTRPLASVDLMGFGDQGLLRGHRLCVSGDQYIFTSLSARKAG